MLYGFLLVISHHRAITAARPEGDIVDTQALALVGAFVRYDGEGWTDGPFVETKDLIAGWYIIDVESWDRAIQLYLSPESVAICPGRVSRIWHHASRHAERQRCAPDH